MFGEMKTVDPKVPCLNLGFPFDQALGKWGYSAFGERICTGGLWRSTGVSAHGNSFKTALIIYMLLIVLKRYHKATGMFYECESALDLDRFVSLDKLVGFGADRIYGQEGFKFTDLSEYEHGNIWWSEFKKSISGRKEDHNKRFTSPFINPATNRPYEFRIPIVGIIDSLSAFGTNSTDLLDEKDERQTIGEAGRNMQAMRDGRAKAELLKELPRVTTKNDLYLIMTAHVGEEHQLNPMVPLRKQMAFLRQGLKFKGVSEQFKYIPNTVWFADSSKALVASNNKEPEYPETGVDYVSRDPDLFEVTYFTIRNKGNNAGIGYPLIFSQSEGYQPHLTAFHFIKENGKKWGIEGSNTNYSLTLAPNIKLSRTTVRTKSNTDRKLQVALQLTANMVDMRFSNHMEWERYGFDTMEEVVAGLKTHGFDLDIILNTRDYWVFLEHEKYEELPYLSAADVLRMAKGWYKPYWYDEVVKGTDWRKVKRVKPNFVERDATTTEEVKEAA